MGCQSSSVALQTAAEGTSGPTVRRSSWEAPALQAAWTPHGESEPAQQSRDGGASEHCRATLASGEEAFLSGLTACRRGRVMKDVTWDLGGAPLRGDADRLGHKRGELLSGER